VVAVNALAVDTATGECPDFDDTIFAI